MRDSAVSPVVGVMLLLSLTIVAAAVLAAFAGGVADERGRSPSADIAVSFAGSGDAFGLMLEHRGGDYLFPKEVKVTGLLMNGSVNSAGSCMLSDVFTEEVWRPGDVVRLNCTRSAGLFGVSVPDMLSAAVLAVPAEVSLYYVPGASVLVRVPCVAEEV